MRWGDGKFRWSPSFYSGGVLPSPQSTRMVEDMLLASLGSAGVGAAIGAIVHYRLTHRPPLPQRFYELKREAPTETVPLDPANEQRSAFQYLLVELQGLKTMIFGLLSASVSLLAVFLAGLLPRQTELALYWYPIVAVLAFVSYLLLSLLKRCRRYLILVKSVVKGHSYGSPTVYLNLPEALMTQIFPNEVIPPRRANPEELQKIRSRIYEAMPHVEGLPSAQGTGEPAPDFSWAGWVYLEEEMRLLPKERERLRAIREYGQAPRPAGPAKGQESGPGS